LIKNYRICWGEFIRPFYEEIPGHIGGETMKTSKKFIITIFVAIMFLLLCLPNYAHAELTDAQRQGIVNVAEEVAKLAQKGILRYTQGAERETGYNDLSKVTKSVKQQTPCTWSLTTSDAQVVLAKLNSELELYGYKTKSSLPQTKFERITTLGADINDCIGFDCSSLVSFLYTTTYGTKVSDTSKMFGNDSKFKKISLSEAKKGDTLWKDGHVGLYLGDYDGDGNIETFEASGFLQNTNKSATSISHQIRDFLISNPTAILGHPRFNQNTLNKLKVQLESESILQPSLQVKITEEKENKLNRWTCAYTYVGEVRQGKSIDVSGISSSNTENNTGTGGKTVEEVNNTKVVFASNTVPKSYWPDNYELVDEELPNSKGFFHRGIPAYGGYSQIVTPFNWLIETAGDVADWFIDFIAYALKIEIVGWTAIIENLVSNGLTMGTESVSDISTNSNSQGLGNSILTGLGIATENKVTVEDVIFNNVPILDIDFFNFSTAGGKQLALDSPLYKIRQTIAGLYYTIRVISIILMLVILLYTTVKAIFTSAIQERANAKEKAMDWLIGFIVVFSIHYFMVGVVALNNQVVQIFKPIASQTQQVNDATSIMSANRDTGSITHNNEESLYEQIRTMAYDAGAITGLLGAFMYMALVIYLLIFVVMYIKRLFILALLTIISPMVGALYALNKSKYKLMTWGKEYITNVIIQLIHAVIYTVVISVALLLAKTSTIMGGIIALVFMAFIFTIERLIKKIFSYDSPSLGGLSDSLVAQIGFYHLGKRTAKFALDTTKGTVNMAKGIGNFALHNDLTNALSKTKLAKATKEYYTEKKSHVKAAGSYFSDVASYYASDATARVNNWIDGEDGRKEGSDNSGRNRASGVAISDDSGGVLIKDRPTYEDYYKAYYYKAKYGAFSPSQKIIDAKRKKVKQARKEFARNRRSILTNSVIATASSALAIPMIVVNRDVGLAIGALGIHSYMKAFSKREINGVTIPKTKFTGKKMLFYMAAPIMGPAYMNSVENAKAENAEVERIERTTLGKEMDILEKAKMVEADIFDSMNHLYANTPKEKGKLQSSINIVERKAFAEAINSILQGVEKGTIEKTVNQYIKEKGTEKLDIEDIQKISKRLNELIPEEIQISDSFTNNIRDQIRRNAGMNPLVEKKVVDKNGNVEVEMTARIEMKDIVKICKNLEKEEKIESDVINELIVDLKKDKKFANTLKLQDPEKITIAIKDKLEEKILDQQKQKDVYEKLREKIDERVADKTRQDNLKIENVLNHLKPNNVVDLISRTLKREDSIKVVLRNSRYDDLMIKVKKLDAVNEEYREVTGKAIYKDVGKLVKDMRDGIISG